MASRRVAAASVAALLVFAPACSEKSGNPSTEKIDPSPSDSLPDTQTTIGDTDQSDGNTDGIGD